MNICKTKIEDACKFLLQKEVSFEINNKTIKQGKIILFQQKNFYILFNLKTKKKNNDKIEIPIPYDVEIHEDDDLIYFDYRIKTLIKNCPEVEDMIKKQFNKGNSNKFWNIILTLDGSLKC